MCSRGVDNLSAPQAPIAMGLANGSEICEGHYHAVLYQRSTVWFRCSHEHAAADHAEVCARSRWFAHHG